MDEQAIGQVEGEVEATRGPGLLSRNFVFLCLSTFFFFVGIQMLTPTLPIYVTNLTGSDSWVGFVVAVLAITSLLSRPFLGLLVDNGHAGRVMLLGTANAAVSSFAYSFATSTPALVLLRLFHGLGVSAVTTAGGWVLAQSAPKHRRGEAAGLFGMATNTALALAPAVGIAVLDASNFGVLFVAIAAAEVVAMALCCVIRVERPATPPASATGPLICRSAVPPSLVLVAQCFAFGASTTFVPIFAQDRAIGSPALFFTANAVASLVCRPLSGRVADVWGRRAVVVPGMAMLALGALVMPAGLGFWGMIVSGAIMGMGQGIAYPGLMALVIDSVPPSQQGSASAMFFGAFDLGFGLGAGVSGVLAEVAGLTAPFFASALMALLGLGYFVAWTRRTSAPPALSSSEAGTRG